MENDEQNQQTPPPTYNQTSDINNNNNNSNEQEQVVQQQPQAALPITSLDEFIRYYRPDITNIRDEYGDRIHLPLGMRFDPLDHELVYYLAKKLTDDPIHNELIMDVNIYNNSPDELTANLQCATEDMWYFYTPRDKKYPNGQRPDRKAGKGYWKATGGDATIVYKDQPVGSRKSLVYQQKRDGKKSSKTNWMMHEYTVHKPLLKGHQVIRCSSSSSMELDKYVLCKIYIKKDNKKNKDATERGSSSQHSASITTAEVDRNQKNLLVPDVEVKAAIKDHGDSNNNVQPAPALRIGNGDFNANNVVRASNLLPQNKVPNDQANLVGMVQLPNATANMYGNISENHVHQVVNPNWFIGGPGPSNYPPDLAAPTIWQNNVSHNYMRGDHNGMPRSTNYHLQNGVPNQFSHGDHINMTENSNYHSQNGVSHQYRHGDHNNNSPENSNILPLYIPPKRQRRLCNQMANVYRYNNFTGTTNNPPSAYRQNNRVDHQIADELSGTSKYQPHGAPANQQNGVAHQITNGDHSNNFPGSGYNHHPLVASANQQSRVANQFTNGDHSNNLSGSSSNHHPFAPANHQNIAPNQFNNGHHSNNVLESNNYHSENAAPNDQLMDPNYSQNTTMLDFNPFAAREGNLVEENGEDGAQMELTEEQRSYLLDKFKI